MDLTRHLGLAQSTVSKHLACLRDCGLVTSRPEGRASVFSLTHPEAIRELWLRRGLHRRLLPTGPDRPCRFTRRDGTLAESVQGSLKVIERMLVRQG